MIKYSIKVTRLFKRHLKKLKRKHFPMDCIIDSLYGIAKDDKQIKHKIKFHPLKNYKLREFDCHPFRLNLKTSRILDDYVIRLLVNRRQPLLTEVRSMVDTEPNGSVDHI